MSKRGRILFRRNQEGIEVQLRITESGLTRYLWVQQNEGEVGTEIILDKNMMELFDFLVNV